MPRTGRWTARIITTSQSARLKRIAYTSLTTAVSERFHWPIYRPTSKKGLDMTRQRQNLKLARERNLGLPLRRMRRRMWQAPEFPFRLQLQRLRLPLQNWWDRAEWTLGKCTHQGFRFRVCMFRYSKFYRMAYSPIFGPILPMVGILIFTLASALMFPLVKQSSFNATHRHWRKMKCIRRMLPATEPLPIRMSLARAGRSKSS